LAYTFALGLGAAVQIPTWQAMMPELVPRTQLRAAAGLDLVSVNLAYAVGPVLAGLAIVYLGGVPVVFGLKTAAVAEFALALLRSPRQRRGSYLAGSASFPHSAPVAATSGTNPSFAASCSE
jgi:MFS family permease